jgi:hypothetical protein
MAQHCAEAGVNEQAIGYWHKAGEQAVARSAMTEAVAQLQKGVLAENDSARTRARGELCRFRSWFLGL